MWSRHWESSAINLKQVLVTFSGAVEAKSATTIANYTYTGVSASITTAPELQADGKSVLITLTSNEAQEANATLKVANVKSVDETLIAPTTTSKINFLDLAVPTAVSATLTAPTKVQVKFSEPVNADTFANSAFTLDDNTYSLGTAPVIVAGTDNTVVEVTLGSPLTTGSHSLIVNPTGVSATNVIKDFASFAVPTTTLTFNYATSVVAPTAVVTSVSQKSAVITFSSPVSFAGAGDWGTDLKVYHTFDTQASYAATNYSLAADNKTLTVTFAAPMVPGNVNLYIDNSATAATQLQDGWGNKFATTTLPGSLVVDSSVPTVTSATKIDASNIDVTFSKAVSGVVPSSFTLKNVAGTLTGISSVTNTSGNTYRIALTNQMNADTYTLAVPAKTIYDGNLTPNYLAAYSTAFVIADSSLPTVNSTIITDAAGANGTQIKVSFSKAMATTGAGSILNASNYVWSTGVFPTGTTFTSADGGKAVLITFANKTQLENTTIVTGHVSDALGNFTAALATGAVAITTDDVVAADFGNAQTTSTSTVTVEVDKTLSAINSNFFTVDGNPVTSATYVNKTLADGITNGALITLKVASGDAWDANDTPTVAITAANAIKTAFGTNNSDAITFPADAIDKTAPALSATLPAVKVTSANTITLSYDEAIYVPSVSIYTYAVAGNTVTNATLGTSANAGVVTLTLKTPLVGNDATASVTQALAIQDASAAHNSLAASSTILIAADAQDPIIAGVTDGTTYKTATPTFTEGTATLSKNSGTAAAYNSATAIIVSGAYELIVTDEAGNTTTVNFTVDATAATLTAGSVVRTDATTGTVKFTSSKAGSYYYSVVASGATAPTIVTTGAGTSCTTAETTITNPTGLTTGAKDLYVVVKDAVGNVSNPLKIAVISE